QVSLSPFQVGAGFVKVEGGLDKLFFRRQPSFPASCCKRVLLLFGRDGLSQQLSPGFFDLQLSVTGVDVDQRGHPGSLLLPRHLFERLKGVETRYLRTGVDRARPDLPVEGQRGDPVVVLQSPKRPGQRSTRGQLPVGRKRDGTVRREATRKLEPIFTRAPLKPT